jgi:peptidyl-prolyl cis-trans isomerase SurA
MKRGQELDLRHILIKPKISAAELQKAEKELDSIKMLISNGKLTFAAAAEKFSDDEDSRLNGGKVVNPQTGDTRWETGQLEKTAFYALEGLKEGEISEPNFFRQPDEKEGYRLLKLNNRSEAHVANLTTDYQRIKQASLSQKQQEALQNWIEEKLKDTYVWVNNGNLNCDFNRNWIKNSQSQYAN